MFGFGKKTSDDEALAIIGALLGNLCRDQLNQVEQVKAGFRATLNMKKNRASSEDEYINSLFQNVGYFIVLRDFLLEDYRKFLKKGQTIKREELDRTAADYQDRVRSSASEWVPRIKKMYEKFPGKAAKLDQLEFDFMYYSTLFQVLLDSLYNLYTRETLVNSLSKADHDKVIEMVRNHVVLWANHIIGNMRGAA